MNHKPCVECPAVHHCGGIGYCLAEVEKQRRLSRLRMDKLTVGERFRIMFSKPAKKTLDPA